MLTIRLKNTEISITFGFLLLLAVNSLIDESYGAYCLFFSGIHELAHLAAMSFYGIRTEYIKLYGGGIKISSMDISLLSKTQQSVIYSAGCAANLAIGMVFYCYGLKTVSLINLFLGLFNLLPVEYFDGGKLCRLLFGGNLKILKPVSYTLTVLLSIAAAIGIFTLIGKLPFSLIATLYIILLAELSDF